MFHIDATAEDLRMIAVEVREDGKTEFATTFIEGLCGKSVELRLTFEEVCDVFYLGMHPDANEEGSWYEKPTIKSYKAKLELALKQKSEATGHAYEVHELSFIP